MDTETKPLSQSATIWGAIAFLVSVVLKGVLRLDDETAQKVAESVLTILTVVGPLVIIWGRFRLQKKLNAALLAVPPQSTAVSIPAAVSNPSNPAAGS